MQPINHYDSLLSTIQDLVRQAKQSRAIVASDIPGLDLPATTLVMRQATFQVADVETEINLTTDAACPPYEWRAEITVRTLPLQHYLLTTSGEIVSAYGKHVEALSTYDTQGLSDHLNSLSR